MGIFRNSKTVSAAYTVLSYDGAIMANTSGGVFDITLPDSVLTNGNIQKGHEIVIMDSGSNFAANNLTIKPDAADGSTIEGNASLVLSGDGDMVVLELMENNVWAVTYKPLASNISISGNVSTALVANTPYDFSAAVTSAGITTLRQAQVRDNATGEVIGLRIDIDAKEVESSIAIAAVTIEFDGN